MWIYVVKGTLDDLSEAQQAQLWDAGAQGLEERGNAVRAYFEGQVDIDGVTGEWLEEAEQDWQAAYKRGIGAVEAGRVTIAPPWLAGDIPATQHALLIEPGMAFGTGHHATTRMAVEALSGQHITGGLDIAGCTVLDVGAGSGVLAMAAAKLGAALAYGLDTDPLTVPVAQENAAANNLSAPQVQFAEGTLRPDTFAAPPEQPELAEGGYDVLVANLFAELHDLLMPAYLQHLRGGGTLILTGILTERLPLVRKALERSGVVDVQETLDGEWALVTGHAPAQQG